MTKFFAGIIMIAFVIIITNYFAKKAVMNRFLADINKAVINGGCIKLNNGITFDFNEGVILNSKGRQIKCIYR